MSTINCDEKPLKELRQAVLKKHGKLHGALKIEFDIALSEHIKKLKNEIEQKGE